MQMTWQQYGALAATCDRLLRAPHATLARLAIPALHFLNEHPSSLSRYASMFEPRDPLHVPKFLWRGLRAAVRSVGVTVRREAYSDAVDVLIVSHLVHDRQLALAGDFYFGTLQRHLMRQGARTIRVLIDHRPMAQRQQRDSPASADTLILQDALPLAAEFAIWRASVVAGRQLRREACGETDVLARGLASLASDDARSADTIKNLRVHSVLADVCQRLNPRLVITTYEGTALERLIWHAARTAARSPLCVGYQHAMILPRAHAIRRPVALPGLPCDPDVVLTTGPLPHEALAGTQALRGTRFIQYGSHRQPIAGVLPDRQHRPRRCLVMPDANDAECATLFGFALRCAALDASVHFVLRPHPLTAVSMLLNRHPVLRLLPRNVSLEPDIAFDKAVAQARCCLYRGSSAALHAARAGLKPYYLACPGELAFDCLEGVTDWRETVDSPEQLIRRMRFSFSSRDDHRAVASSRRCNRYFADVDPEALQALLSAAPSAAQDIVRNRSSVRISDASPAR